MTIRLVTKLRLPECVERDFLQAVEGRRNEKKT